MSACNSPPLVRFYDLPVANALLLGVLASLLALAPLASTARAEYGPGAIVASATTTQLGDRDSSQPAISRDSRYVAFRTGASALLGPSPDPTVPFTTGIVRKDLLTGAVDVVAPPGAGGTISISGDGRYVLFETSEPLVPGDANTRSDVYVRDMTRGLTDVDAYELVSSLDGPEKSPSYASGGTASRAGQLGASLSMDGRTAVFWTDSPSNLPTGSATAPRAQVFVRSLDRQETRLVTRDKADPTLPGTPVPVAPGSGYDPQLTTPLPVLSGDGTKVAWQDSNLGREVDLLPGEPTSVGGFLWRDLTAGPGALPRRVTGLADADDPGCPPGFVFANDPAATGPCYGPFASGEADDPSRSSQFVGYRLSMSDDGRRLLFISNAKRRPDDPQLQRPGVYLVDMTPGLSRKQATREPFGASKALWEAGRGILEAALSGDGRHVVFSSRNNAFDGLRPIGTFQTGELIATNLFAVDLDGDSVERVTRGYDGSDYLGPLIDPQQGGGNDDTFVERLATSEDASTVAFQAADGNLFVGDANSVNDVQVVRRVVTVAPPVLDPQPAPPAVRADAKVTPLKPIHPIIGYVVLGKRGVATVRVRVPAAGRLGAQATSRSRAGRVMVGKANRRLRRPASVTLRIWPSKAALKALRRQARLKVVMRIRYRPRSGASTGASRSYALTRGEVR
jgi:Tol biopolymer transport system component